MAIFAGKDDTVPEGHRGEFILMIMIKILIMKQDFRERSKSKQ